MEKNKNPKKILLFISPNSSYFSTDLDNFKKIAISLSNQGPLEIEVVNVLERPELAEKYKIIALPTLIIGDKRYVGKPTPEKAIEIFSKKI